jgi:hypothetical protein
MWPDSINPLIQPETLRAQGVALILSMTMCRLVNSRAKAQSRKENLLGVFASWREVHAKFGSYALLAILT